ncbi:Crp/Fnr family transcriptional regulator [Salinimicrobium flavum]|uniref:Crp/Fnr family transcriptional regulator n=1 Tax=Salinimicrobium flavum TaxID=1737065 RepID=A0ABW5IZX7_9FLAO
MSLTDYLVKTVPFPSGELEDIVSHFERETIPKNQPLVKEGQICSKLYFVEQGVGRSYYLKEDGKEITQWFFVEGHFMSSIESFFQQNPSLYYLEMLEDAVLYSITRDKLDLLFSRYHNMEKLGRLLSTEMLTRVVNKLNAIQFQTARERYDYMLSEYPELANRVALGYIASYLGMTQETLSRIRKT